MADTVSCALRSCRVATRPHLFSNLVEGRNGRRGGGGGGGGGGGRGGRGGVVAAVVGGGRQPGLCLKSGIRVLLCLRPASQCRDRARWCVLADATCRPYIAPDVSRSCAPDFVSGPDRGSGVIGDGVVRISRRNGGARHRASERRKLFLPIVVSSHNKNSDELRKQPSSRTPKASKKASNDSTQPSSSSSSSPSHSASLLRAHPRHRHHHHRKRRWTLVRLLAWFRLMRFLMKRRIAGLMEPVIIAMKHHRWVPAAMAGVLFAMTVLVVDQLTPKPPPPKLVLYSQFVNELRDHKVKRVQFEEGSNKLYFDLLEDEPPVKSELMTKASTDAVAVGFSGQDRSLVKKEVMGGGSPSSPIEIEGMKEDGSSTQGTLPSVLGRSKGGPHWSFSVFHSLQRAFNFWLQKQPVMVHKASPPMVMKKKWRFVTRRISGDEAFLLSMLRDAKVPHAVVPQPPSAALRNVLYTILALWIPLVPLLLFFRRAMGGSDSASKAKKRLQRDVKFSDVAGVDEAKAELQEIVNCLRDSGLYRRIGAQLPKGILLVGPPGTGKTLLAKAVAGEAAIPFLAASASEFVELFVGRGAARVRELFAEARKVAPSIVFIDELDAVGGKRGTSFNEERDQTLNQLLTEMDGFESDTGVIVLAATNRPESLDPALCRPGRISRRVYVEAPDLKGREEILAVHMLKVKVQGSPDRICRIIALATPTCAGADLANIVNEAALLAARNGKDAAEMEDFLEAVDRALYGVGGKKDWRKSVKRQLDKWLGMDLTNSKENISRRKQLPWNRDQGPGINVATTQ